MKKIVVICILFINFMYGLTNNELLNPDVNIYDFTFDSVEDKAETFNPETTVSKIELSVDKVLGEMPRTFVYDKCGLGSYANKYCPIALYDANEYWGYVDSSAETKIGTVEDFTNSVYTVHTGSVRDFVNGTYLPHVSTEINYSNGTTATHTGTVVDYTNKNGCPAGTILEGGICLKTENKLSCDGEWHEFGERGFFNQGISGVQKGLITDYSYTSGNVTFTTKLRYQCTSRTAVRFEQYHGVKGTVNHESWALIFASLNMSNFELNENYTTGRVQSPAESWADARYYVPRTKSGKKLLSYQYMDGIFVTISRINNQLFFKVENTYDGQGWTTRDVVEGYSPLAYKTAVDKVCPTGYVETTGGETAYGECKRNVSYNYYSYGCPVGYAVQNAGFTSWIKTDPNYTVVNYDTLDDDVNSSTPPANNCIQTLNSTAYEYTCGAGYTVIDAGLTSCPSGTSGACNNQYPPQANCYKDVSYKYYEYGCPDPYKTDNHGLTSCKKTDPDVTKNNEGTLNDDCNSPVAPDGNCVAEVDFEYYEYICSGTNEFNEIYTPIEIGLTTCTKTDSDITSSNSNLSESCNSSTPPSNNCKAKEYSCNSNYITPAFVDGKWQCSPYVCNQDMQCGYGTCLGQEVSQTEIMPYSFHPIEALTRSGDACQAVSCKTNYEYSDGVATKVDKKLCDGTIINEKCMLNGTDVGFDEYYYYTYKCPTGTNSFGNSWDLTFDNTDPGCVDDTFGKCTNFEIETSVCRRKIYACPLSGGGSCNKVNGAYQCTLEGCEQNRIPCLAQTCDLALNDKISYCENPACPDIEGVYEVDGECKVMSCPDGTFELDGNCIKE